MNDELDFDFSGAAKKPPAKKPVPKPTPKPVAHVIPSKPSRWDIYDGPRPYDRMCQGTVEEMRANILQLLDEVQKRITGELKPYNWEIRSKNYPWLQVGSALLQCIYIADAIWEKQHAANKKED